MTESTSKVYSMPFAIQSPMTITSDIKRHFTNSIEEKNDEFHASFRGRPLNGKCLTLPEDYLGLLTIGNQPIDSFDKVTYFNLDCSPSIKDSFARSIQWLSLAKILHE